MEAKINAVLTAVNKLTDRIKFDNFEEKFENINNKLEEQKDRINEPEVKVEAKVTYLRWLLRITIETLVKEALERESYSKRLNLLKRH